jgi:hypothetical protein
MGHYIRASKEQQILFFRNLEKNLFSEFMENTLKGEKSIEISVSPLIMEQHEKIFWSSLSTLDRSDWAKKPSHASVPLKVIKLMWAAI